DLREQSAAAELRVLVVDNASTPPLAPAADRLRGEAAGVELLRLEANVGGSGGFNAGMAQILRDSWAELVWLLDSDARLDPGALTGLLAAIQRPDVAVAGSALADPETGEVFELGGFVDRR